MKVASLVVHYNLDKLTDTAVACLKKQTHKNDIYVFDAGSDTPYSTKDAVVIRVPESPGLSGSWNRGMEILGNRYDLIFQYTNDVALTTRHDLQNLVGLMTAHYDLAAVQPSMPSSHKHLRHIDGVSWKPARFLEWAAVLMSLTAWVDVGPLDEGFNFFSMDIDWSHRAIKKGWWLAVVHKVEAKHVLRGTHNETAFDISNQARIEHQHGKLKYHRDDWQAFLKGEVK